MDGPEKPGANGIKVGSSLIGLAFLVAWLVGIASLTAQVMITPADGLIRGEALSILHKFSVDVQDFVLEITPASSPGRWQIAATIPVAGITTGLGPRDRQMYRQVFRHGKLDTVRYLGQIDGNFVSGSHQVVGSLTINGQTHPQRLTVHVQASADTLTLRGEIAISLQVYGIHIGIVKDSMRMEFQFTLPRSRLKGGSTGMKKGPEADLFSRASPSLQATHDGRVPRSLGGTRRR